MMARMMILVLVIAEFIAPVAVAWGQGQEMAGGGQDMPPSAHELWNKLLVLVEQPEGLVTKELIEGTLGVKLVYSEKHKKFSEEHKKYFPPSDLYYVSREEGQWYFDLRIFTYKSGNAEFSFGWGQQRGLSHQIPFPHPPVGMCLNVSQLFPDIERRGWTRVKGGRLSFDIPEFNNYRKGKKGLLKISYYPKDSCLIGLEIVSDEKADLIVR